MKAIVSHGVGDIRPEDVSGPINWVPTDAVARLTASAIRGASPGMVPDTILGPEGGVMAEEVGKDVRNAT